MMSTTGVNIEETTNFNLSKKWKTSGKSWCKINSQLLAFNKQINFYSTRMERNQENHYSKMLMAEQHPTIKMLGRRSTGKLMKMRGKGKTIYLVMHSKSTFNEREYQSIKI